MLKHDYADVNGVRLHYVSQGSGRLIMFLHGFPEFWHEWRRQLDEFGTNYQAVAVDMRGYNLSSKPAEVEQYKMEIIVEDIRQLAEHLGHKKFTLVGHDLHGCGYYFAAEHPDYLENLVAINSPHPNVLDRELRENPEQRKAQEYTIKFCQPNMETRLAENNYFRLVRLAFGDLIQRGFMAQDELKPYFEAWSQPGAITGCLNYYRAYKEHNFLQTPNAPPRPSYMVNVRTLAIWGEKDPAMLIGNTVGLQQYVPNLILKRIPDAGHRVIHEKPELVNRLIRDFIEGRL